MVNSKNFSQDRERKTYSIIDSCEIKIACQQKLKIFIGDVIFCGKFRVEILLDGRLFGDMQGQEWSERIIFFVDMQELFERERKEI